MLDARHKYTQHPVSHHTDVCVYRESKIYFHVGNSSQPFISDTHAHTHAHTQTRTHTCTLRNVQLAVPAVGLVCVFAGIGVNPSYTRLNQTSSECVSYAAHWRTADSPDSKPVPSVALGQDLLIKARILDISTFHPVVNKLFLIYP